MVDTYTLGSTVYHFEKQDAARAVKIPNAAATFRDNHVENGLCHVSL